MTAIYMAVGSNGVLMISDGAAYDEDGVLRQIHSKQIVAADLDLVISSSGSGPINEFIRLHLARENPLSFDHFHAVFPGLMREILDEMRDYFGKSQYSSILYGGYSGEKEKYAGYFIASYAVEGMNQEAFVPLPIQVFGKPNVSPEMIEKYELGEGAYERLGPLEYGLRFMAAVRQSPYELHGRNTTHGYGVGGYVEQSFLQKGVANTQIVWRWPDEIGRLIDPSGDPPIGFVSGEA